MPFAKRSISPVNVSQHRLPQNVRQNELECVANGTLANLIRQLSSLSRHAEDIFGELYREAVKIEHKTNTLFNRIDRLAIKVTQLDSKIEEVSLQDLHLRKPFKSSAVIDQQSLNRQTMPVAMAECYSRCDRPPDLDKLNQFRDDGKSGLKFYTDPDYFFALWREEMLKDADNVKKVHKTKNPSDKRRKPRQSQEQRQKYYDKSMVTRPAAEQTQAQMDYHQQLLQDEPGAHPLANGRVQAHPQYLQHQNVMMRPESLELQYGTSGYGSADSTVSSQQHFRLQSQQRASAQQSALIAAQYAMINRNQASSIGAGGAHLAARNEQLQRRNGNSIVSSEASSGTTPTALGDANQMSPRSQESTDSGQSRGAYGHSRPSQPPPAPPPAMPNLNGQRNAATANGDLPNRLADLHLVGDQCDVSPPPPPPPMGDNFGVSDRSSSPDLPPPPPPLAPAGLHCSDYSDKVPSPPPPLVTPASSSSFVTASSPPSNAAHGSPVNYSHPRQHPPPPPPPPPPPAKGNEDKAPAAGAVAVSVAKSTISCDSRTLDARSDLLRAIKQGIQLKKVDRQEEKARDDAAVEKGHDVAAILKRRMEDVMGRSESEGSASDFEDDWDD